jgi:hypothetical protein
MSLLGFSFLTPAKTPAKSHKTPSKTAKRDARGNPDARLIKVRAQRRGSVTSVQNAHDQPSPSAAGLAPLAGSHGDTSPRVAGVRLCATGRRRWAGEPASAPPQQHADLRVGVEPAERGCKAAKERMPCRGVAEAGDRGAQCELVVYRAYNILPGHSLVFVAAQCDDKTTSSTVRCAP